jgi:hypothetical protein
MWRVEYTTATLSAVQRSGLRRRVKGVVEDVLRVCGWMNAAV